MKKLVLLAAASASLGLWGCSHSSAPRADAHQPSYQRPLERRTPPATQPADLNEKERAQRDRQGAPTVYDGEATGGAGSSATPPECQPSGNDAPRK